MARGFYSRVFSVVCFCLTLPRIGVAESDVNCSIYYKKDGRSRPPGTLVGTAQTNSAGDVKVSWCGPTPQPYCMHSVGNYVPGKSLTTSAVYFQDVAATFSYVRTATECIPPAASVHCITYNFQISDCPKCVTGSYSIYEDDYYVAYCNDGASVGGSVATNQESSGATSPVSSGSTNQVSPRSTTQVSSGTTNQVSSGVTTQGSSGATTQVSSRATTKVSSRATTQVSSGATNQVSSKATTQVSSGATNQVSCSFEGLKTVGGYLRGEVINGSAFLTGRICEASTGCLDYTGALAAVYSERSVVVPLPGGSFVEYSLFEASGHFRTYGARSSAFLSPAMLCAVSGNSNSGAQGGGSKETAGLGSTGGSAGGSAASGVNGSNATLSSQSASSGSSRAKPGSRDGRW